MSEPINMSGLRIVRVVGAPGEPTLAQGAGNVEVSAKFEASREWWDHLTAEALAQEVEHVARVTTEVDARHVLIIGDGFGATVTQDKALAWVEGRIIASGLRKCESGLEVAAMFEVLPGERERQSGL